MKAVCIFIEETVSDYVEWVCNIIMKKDINILMPSSFKIAIQVEILKDFIRTSGAYGFIYLLDNKPIGLAYACRLARPDGKIEMYLHSIYILPQYQNKGYGTRFL